MRGRGLEVDGHPVNCCPYLCMEDEGGGGGGGSGPLEVEVFS